MFRIIKYALLPVVAVGSLYGVTSLTMARGVRSVHERLVASKAVGNFYEKLLRSYFETYHQGESVCINEVFKEDCINIVLVDANKFAAATAYKGNFVAVGSNLIVIDKVALDYVLVQANYGLKSQMAKFIFRDSNLGKFATDVLWGQQFTNIYRITLNSDLETLNQEVARIKAGIDGTSSGFPGIPEDIIAKFGSIPDDLTRKMTSISLGFILEHEIGHLRLSPVRRLMLRLPYLLQLEFDRASKVEEDEVDDISRVKLDKLAETARNLSSVMEGTNIERTVLYSNFMLFWNYGMFGFFENSRGLYAEDYIYEINFSGCKLDSNLYSIIPDQVFAMVPILVNARLKPFPILTANELNNFKDYISRTRSHSHSLIRALSLLDMIVHNLDDDFKEAFGQKSNYDREQMGIDPGLFKKIYDGNPKGDSTYKSALPSLSIAREDLLNRIDRSVRREFEDGYLCEFDKCDVYVGNESRVELISDANDVHEIRISAKWPNARNDAAWSSLVSYAADKLDLDLDKISSEVDSLSNECPGSFRIFQNSNKGGFVYASKMATKPYVFFRVLAAE